MANDIVALLDEAEIKYGLPRGLLHSQMQAESGGNPNAVSPKGARGLMQFMPATAKELGIDPHNPAQAIDGAGRYMKTLIDQTGNVDDAIGAYNWGIGNVKRKGMANAPKETRDYVAKVTGKIQTDDFDPDVYLASKTTETRDDFDPDSYLAEKSTQPIVTQSPVDDNEYTAQELLELRKQGVNIGNLKMKQQTFRDDLNAEIAAHPFEARLGALGAGLSNTWEGAKGLFGADDKQQIEANAAFRENNPAIGVAGDVALFTGAGLAAPVVNTVAGASALGGAYGFLQPADSMIERTGNALVGGGMAAGVTKGALAIGNRALEKIAAKKLAKARNSTFDASTKEALDAGFEVPRSMYNPSFTSNRIESFGGKAAVQQTARDNNQAIADSLVRKAIGVSDDTALDDALMSDLRYQAAAPYRAAETLADDVVGKTSIRAGATGKTIERDVVKNGKQLVDEINIARDNWRALRQDAFSATGTARNAARKAADDAKSHLATLENQLDKMAIKQGKPKLVKELSQARAKIAEIHTVEDALNSGTGSVDAAVLARRFQKGKPMGDELKRVGRFAAAFDRVAPRGKALSGADISALEPLAGAIYGAAGSAATGNAAGALAGGVPLLRSPARAFALSKLMQRQPNYDIGTINYLSKLLSARNAPMAIAGATIPSLTE